MKIRIVIPDQNTIAAKLGVNKSGIAQLFHTTNVLRHMQKYMPMQTGMFSTKQTIITSPTTITTRAVQAYYLYYGKRMVNAKTGKGAFYIPGVGWRHKKGAVLVATNEDLHYTRTFHPLAGAFWDRRMMAAEGDVVAAELKAFIERTAKK